MFIALTKKKGVVSGFRNDQSETFHLVKAAFCLHRYCVLLKDSSVAVVY